MLLDLIQNPNDIKTIPPQEYDALAAEIRSFILERISENGGHLASNLGVVELTMALHLSFDLPEDKLIWDVGHQSYTHKILTGRKDAFESIRSFGGISGFPNRQESDCDPFTTGHSSTSVSAGLGLAHARDLSGDHYHIVSIMGDGSLTGGMIYEALNNASRLKSGFIIVLNDNNMSISENIGGVSRMMTNIRSAQKYNSLKENVVDTLEKVPVVGESLVRMVRNTKSSLKQLIIPGMFFENIGLTYLGPYDGSNIHELLGALRNAKRMNRPVVVHVMTKKGSGYPPAEKHPEIFHGIGPFDLATGKPKDKPKTPTYDKLFSDSICRLAAKDDSIVCITAAMADGVGLKKFSKQFPRRFFDVGIAEEHAVTFAGGLAAGGLHPYVCVYSSFLQRAYDQMIHDVCLQHLPVTFIISRAGVVGADGETHQGILDLSYLSSIPGMTVFAPKNAEEFRRAVEFSAGFDRPLAIRVPRGGSYSGFAGVCGEIVPGKAEVLFREKDIALLAIGSMVEVADEVRNTLKAEGRQVSLINARFAAPLDRERIRDLAKNHSLIVTMEENVHAGGFGEHVGACMAELGSGCRQLNISIPDCYVEHGSQSQLRKNLGLDAASVTERIRAALDEVEHG